MSLCGICDEKINVKGYKIYGCEFCPVWLHASCVFPNASEDKLKILFEFNTGFCVMCRECKQNFKDQRSSLATKDDIKLIVDAIKSQPAPSILNEELTKCVPEFVNEVAAKCGEVSFAEIVKQQKEELESLNSAQAINFASKVRKELSTDSIIQQLSNKKEEDEKMKRKCNLILFGLPESKFDSPAKRITEDCAKVKNIYEERLSLSAFDVKNIMRLGYSTENKNEKRPLLIQCESENKKWEMLRASKNLKYVQEHESFPIFAAPDRTEKEREERKMLVTQLKQRRDKGEENLIIRKNRIVTKLRTVNGADVEPFQRPAQNAWADLFKSF